MWPNPQFPVDLVTFTEKILNGNLHLLRSGGFSVESEDVKPLTYAEKF